MENPLTNIELLRDYRKEAAVDELLALLTRLRRSDRIPVSATSMELVGQTLEELSRFF